MSLARRRIVLGRTALALGLASVVAGAAAVAAIAVPPGADGPIFYDASDVDTGGTNIFAISPSGSGATNLTPGENTDTDPAVSPDGRRIAFVSDRDNGTNVIWVMNADGTAPRKLGGGGTQQATPAWSPNGKQIAVSRCLQEQESGGQCVTAQIAVVSSDGTSVKAVTKPSKLHVVVDSMPTWTPDGKTIVFERTLDFGYVSLWSVRADGTGLKRLVNDGGQIDKSPSVSPNGKQIVYASDPDGNESLYLVSTSGGKATSLNIDIPATGGGSASSGGSTGGATSEEAPSFSPSGKRIVFVSGGDLWAVDANGKNPAQVTQDGGDHPDWGRA